ncbi:MAG: RidA family protein [Acidobacteriota bacterium]
MNSTQTEKAPAAIGPYSQAIVVESVAPLGLVFTSGQIPLDPQTMQVVGDDIRTQTIQVLSNLRAVLEAAGSSLQRVVRTTVYLADMADFAAMNEVYAEAFHPARPARSTIQAARLPRDVRVEIDAVAIIEPIA